MQRTVLTGDLELLRRKIVEHQLGTRVADGVSYGSVHMLHAVEMDDTKVRLGVVWRGIWTIRAAVSAAHPLVATSGSFADVTSLRTLHALPSLSGTVVHEGAHDSRASRLPSGERWDQIRDAGGHRRSIGAHVAYIAGAAGQRWNFGLGAAPVRILHGQTVTTAIDGLGPLILSQRLFTDNQWYRNLLLNSDPLGSDERMGLVMLAHHPGRHRLFLVVQHHEASEGDRYTLHDLRDLANALGCHHAVALDGSTSAMLSCAGHWHVENSWGKDLVNPNAVAFFAA